MNNNEKFTWNFTIVYVPGPYDKFYIPAEQALEDKLASMSEYSDAMAVINKVKYD